MKMTGEEARRLFDYRYGQLFWKVRNSNRIRVGQSAGTLIKGGYVHIKANGKFYLRHRLIFIWHHGREATTGLDHINRIPGDDRIENLRECTHQENHFNRDPKGYTWYKPTGKWRAQIMVSGRQIHIGYYDTEEAARAAYLAAKAVHHQIAA
jgi:HNH endonuclease/AP2 domain